MIEDHFYQRAFLPCVILCKRYTKFPKTSPANDLLSLKNGKRLSAVELQWQYFECAKRYLEQAESDPTTDEVMARWEYVMTCLEEDPMQLERELDWVIKRKWLETYVHHRSLNWDSAEVRRLDLEYHNIRQDEGIFYKAEKRDLTERILDDAQIRHAMHAPPERTRAKFRGRFIKLVNNGKVLCGVNWELYPTV